MMTDQGRAEGDDTIWAPLNYVDPGGIEGTNFTFTFDHQWTGVPAATQIMPIVDACSLTMPAQLRSEGFEQVQIDCPPLSNLPPEFIEDHWRPALFAAIRNLTGADMVIGWGFSARFSERKMDVERTDVSNPARRVHGDFSPTEFGEVIRHPPCLDAIAAVADGRTLCRWIGINAWQPFSAPPYDTPLAVCDARTVSPRDLNVGRGRAPSRPDLAIDLPFFAFNPNHRWHYFSTFEQNEALLFIGLDSACPGTWRLVPHTAFDNPECPADAPPRCSVEMRTMALLFE